MKKLFFFACAGLLMTSCYSSSVSVGDVSANETGIKVATKSNPHFLYGLVSSNKSKCNAKDYVGDATAYRIVRKQTFVDGLLSSITFGIYTPTTTTFYKVK